MDLIKSTLTRLMCFLFGHVPQYKKTSIDIHGEKGNKVCLFCEKLLGTYSISE